MNRVELTGVGEFQGRCQLASVVCANSILSTGDDGTFRWMKRNALATDISVFPSKAVERFTWAVALSLPDDFSGEPSDVTDEQISTVVAANFDSFAGVEVGDDVSREIDFAMMSAPPAPGVVEARTAVDQALDDLRTYVATANPSPAYTNEVFTNTQAALFGFAEVEYSSDDLLAVREVVQVISRVLQVLYGAHVQNATALAQIQARLTAAGI
jgi:hypothetical protein